MAYATRADLTTLGIAAAAIDGIDDDVQDAALQSASDKADGYLRSRFQLPLVAPYPSDLIEAVCSMAAWILLKTRGFDPENAADMSLKDSNKEALRWLEQVRDGKIDPNVTDSQTGGTFENQGGPFVQAPVKVNGTLTAGTPKPRGW